MLYQEEQKKQLTQEAQKQAVDHFAGKEEQLKKAMDLILRLGSTFQSRIGITALLNVNVEIQEQSAIMVTLRQ